MGVCVRDVAEWIRGTLASRREAKQRAAAILFVGSITELSPGAALLASEPDLPRLPFAEDGIIDAESGTVLETLPFAGQKAGPRINGDAVHNTDPPGRAGILRLPREPLRQQAGAQADETKGSRGTCLHLPEVTGGERGIHRNGEGSAQAGTPSVGLGSV
jgi:hypothetical protein